ncbi:MAG: DUF4386 family protein [Eubacteriales bacterium]
MKPTKKTARVAGLMFLLMVVSGMFAELFFRQKLFTADAAQVPNILQNTLLFRAGILGDIIMSLSYLLTALLLYKLLRSVSEDKARLMVLCLQQPAPVILLMNITQRIYAACLRNRAVGALNTSLAKLSALGFAAYNNDM